MTAKDTARRLVAAHGSPMDAWWRIAPYLMHRSRRFEHFGMPHDAARLTFWRAVASALARETA